MLVKLNITRVLLGLILILGLTVRLWGNTFGLLDRYAPDEAKKVHTAVTYEERGFRHSSAQPSFLYNSLYLLFKIANLVRSSIEKNTYYQRIGLPKFEQKAIFLWLGRCWMALLGTITTYLSLIHI